MSVIQYGTVVPKSLTVTRDGKTLVVFAVKLTEADTLDLREEKIHLVLNTVEEHFQRIAARNARFKPGKFAIPKLFDLNISYDENDKDKDGLVPPPSVARCVVWSFLGTPDDILSAYDDIFASPYLHKSLWWWYDKDKPYANLPSACYEVVKQ